VDTQESTEDLDQVEAIPESLTITLRKPVTFATITYTEIKLREPLGFEWEQWDGLRGAAIVMMAISVIAAIPLPAVKQIGTRDLNEARRYIDNFF
jgi:hypothetical protein